MKPFVSIIIPCRNEEKYIEDCLFSIFKQDYPKDRYEIIIVDGISEDSTRMLINNYMNKLHRNGVGITISMLDNPKKTTPCALNIGIKAALGDYIVRIDAHANYPKDYLSKSIDYSVKTNADNVGGLRNDRPGKDTLMATCLNFCTRFKFGIGGGKNQSPETVI